MDIINSTRAVAAFRVCNSNPGFDPMTVVSWQEECAMRQCDACPNWQLPIPEGRNEEVVTLALWGDKFCAIKGKKVRTYHVASITSTLLKIHGRFPETMTLQTLVNSFNSDLAKLTTHLYTAYRQWSSCKLLFNSLRPGEVATQEDYQQNVTVR